MKTKLSEKNRASILFLCDDHRSHANTVLDHISAFVRYSSYDIHLYNPRWVRTCFALDLDEFDVVVIHYSIFILSTHYFPEDLRAKCRRFSGPKILFIQDDYRRIEDIAAMMRDIGVQVLFTLYPEEQVPKVWDERRLPGVVKISTLAGYIPDRLVGMDAPASELRAIDIGYRGRTVPYWLGEFGQEKAWIGQGILSRAEAFGLRCDIAWNEEARIYGDAWNEFIASCKATLGTESGASITDFDGSVEKEVRRYLAQHPCASFDEIHELILKPYEGNVPIKVISPRMFEAIALRTALILFPGHYSGILKPWIHYIPLRKDFANLDEVAEKLRDIDFIYDLTERAYRDIVGSNRYSLRTFIRKFDEVVTKYAPYDKRRPEIKFRYWLSRVERPLCLGFFKIRDPLVQLVTLIMVGPHLEALLTLKYIGADACLRRMFTKYVLKFNRFSSITVKAFLKDILLLKLLRLAHAGELTIREPFRVSIQCSFKDGSIVFTSLPPGNDRLIEEDESDSALVWSSIYSALLKGQILQMVWDHSALDSNIFHRRVLGLWVATKVGKGGIREFSSLINVTRRGDYQDVPLF